MHPLLRKWRRAADELGIQVSGPLEVQVAGNCVRAQVLVHGFGGQAGMLVVERYEEVSSHTQELVDAGFGYCVMSSPRSGDGYDRDTLIEVLSDWGWSGDPALSPSWLK